MDERKRVARKNLLARRVKMVVLRIKFSLSDLVPKCGIQFRYVDEGPARGAKET